MFDQKLYFFSKKKQYIPSPHKRKPILRKKCPSSGEDVCYRGNASYLWQGSQVRWWTGMAHCSHSCYLISLVLIAPKAMFSLNFISSLSILIFYLREEDRVILRLTRYGCRSRPRLRVHIHELSVCQSYGSWALCVEILKKSYLDSRVSSHHHQLESLSYLNKYVIKKGMVRNSRHKPENHICYIRNFPRIVYLNAFLVSTLVFLSRMAIGGLNVEGRLIEQVPRKW